MCVSCAVFVLSAVMFASLVTEMGAGQWRQGVKGGGLCCYFGLPALQDNVSAEYRRTFAL